MIFYFTAATYAEATTMYPEAGGSSSFARHAFNEFWSFFAAWGQMLNYVITVSISAFFVPHYIGGLFWEPLRHAPGDILFGIGVIVVLAAINVFGVRESAGVNIVLALVDLATQVLLVVVGAVLVLSPETLVNNIDLGVAPTWKDFFIAIPIGMIAYTGIETISNMAEEARDQDRTIPKAINRVVIAVFAIYAALPAVALSALPVIQAGANDPLVRSGDLQPGESYTLLGLGEEQGGFAGDPVLGVVKNLDLGPLQGAGEIYVGLLAATILFIATNAGILGVSRLVYSMGVHRQVPDSLRRLHPKFGTPWIGILVFGAIACLTLIPGQATFLGNMYAFGAMLSFTIAHLAVIRLRVKEPDRRRPFTGPGVIPLFGRRLPLFAVLGGLGTGMAFVVVTALHLDVAVAGFGWLALGVVVYVAYRKQQGLDLVSTRKIAIPGPVVDREAEYDSILVAFDYKNYVAGGGRDGREARCASAPRHPRPRHDPGAQQRAAERGAARAGAGGAGRDRAGKAARRQARVRPLGEDARGAGRPPDRRGGQGDARAGDRHADAATRREHAVRQDARDRAVRASVPGDHRGRPPRAPGVDSVAARGDGARRPDAVIAAIRSLS